MSRCDCSVSLANPDVCRRLCRPFLFLPQHPIHFLFKKFYTSISPIGGHDGFDQPAGGSFIHYLVRSLSFALLSCADCFARTVLRRSFARLALEAGVRSEGVSTRVLRDWS